MADDAKEKFGKCPVDANLAADAVERTFASEYLCEDEYGVGVGDPSVGWWSNNWVNTPAMGPGPTDGPETVAGDDLDNPFLLVDTLF